MNVHHGRCDPHARHFRVQNPLEITGEMAHIRGGATHIKSDDTGFSGNLRGAHRPHNATRRTAQDRILSLEQLRIRQTARGLHEHQLTRGITIKSRGHTVHIPPQNRRQIRIHNGRVPARHHLHQGRNLMADRNLAKAQLPRDLPRTRLMRGISIPMHKDDRTGINPIRLGRTQSAPQSILIQRGFNLPIRPNTLIRLNDLLINHLGLDNVTLKQSRPRLISQFQLIAQTFSGDQNHAITSPLQQSIGGHGGAHLNRVNL